MQLANHPVEVGIAVVCLQPVKHLLEQVLVLLGVQAFERTEGSRVRFVGVDEGQAQGLHAVPFGGHLLLQGLLVVGRTDSGTALQVLHAALKRHRAVVVLLGHDGAWRSADLGVDEVVVSFEGLRRDVDAFCAVGNEDEWVTLGNQQLVVAHFEGVVRRERKGAVFGQRGASHVDEVLVFEGSEHHLVACFQAGDLA